MRRTFGETGRRSHLAAYDRHASGAYALASGTVQGTRLGRQEAGDTHRAQARAVNSNSTRYCDCGTRLARDNPSSRCGACQAKARDLVVRSPEVPAKFWATDRMRDALATWHMGRVVAAYRNHAFHGRPLPQETVAGWVGITQAQLSRIESGQPIKDLGRLIEWARVLHVPAPLLWFKLPEQRLVQAPEELALAQPASEDGPVRGYPLASKRAASVLDVATSDDAFVATPALAVRLAHEWLVTEPPQIVESRAGRQIGEGLTRTVERRVEQLRHMDDFIGGNDLYALVAKELRTTVSILKEAGYSEMLGKRFLTAVGELCQLAGRRLPPSTPLADRVHLPR